MYLSSHGGVKFNCVERSNNSYTTNKLHLITDTQSDQISPTLNSEFSLALLGRNLMFT